LEPHACIFGSISQGKPCIGDIQDVVTLVIRQVPLQEVEVLIEVPDQSDLASQEVDGPDATGCDPPDLLAHLVVDVRGGHHRLGAFDAGPVLDAAEDSSLASVQPAMDTGVHSKTSWWRRDEAGQVPRFFAETRGFSSLLASKSLVLRLVED
jgi:hypothetical protein